MRIVEVGVWKNALRVEAAWGTEHGAWSSQMWKGGMRIIDCIRLEV
jgi:hypothetical protein